MPYPVVLPRPPYLSDFHGAVRVRVRYDNKDLTLSQPCGPVELPANLPVAPLVTLEALANNGKPLLPPQVWDYQGDRGRGGWSMYDERFFPVPKSQPEVEPEPESVETELKPVFLRPEDEELESPDEAVVDEDEDVEEDD